MSGLLQASAHSAICEAGDLSPCPECGTPFLPRKSGQLFCTPEHRDGWNNRTTVRGRVLTGLAIVARITRNGTRISHGGTSHDLVYATRASRDEDRLIRRWIAEDRAAGRMEWPEYMRRRYAAGFEPT